MPRGRNSFFSRDSRFKSKLFWPCYKQSWSIKTLAKQNCQNNSGQGLFVEFQLVNSKPFVEYSGSIKPFVSFIYQHWFVKINVVKATCKSFTRVSSFSWYLIAKMCCCTVRACCCGCTNMKTGLLIYAGVDAILELMIAILFYMTTGK